MDELAVHPPAKRASLQQGCESSILSSSAILTEGSLTVGTGFETQQGHSPRAFDSLTFRHSIEAHVRFRQGVTVKDKIGVEIETGDEIIYAALAGRCAVLHQGLVLGFKEMTDDFYHRKPFTKIKVEIDTWNRKKKKIVYLEFPDRVIVTKKKE